MNTHLTFKEHMCVYLYSNDVILIHSFQSLKLMRKYYYGKFKVVRDVQHQCKSRSTIAPS